MRQKIHQLEGIRGFGAFLIFICHFQVVIVPWFYHSSIFQFFERIHPRLGNLAVTTADLPNNGYMFMHTFWGMSAYVIFKKFFSYGASEGTMLAEMVKRYFRLMLPCAVSIFFSYAIFSLGLIYVTQIPIKTPQENLYAFTPSFWHAVKTSVWNTLFNYNYADSLNGVLWSMQREFYGSIFCFAFFAVTSKTKQRLMIYCIAFIIAFSLKVFWLNSFLLGYFLADYDFSSDKSEKLAQLVKKINRYIESHQRFIFAIIVCGFMIGKLLINRFPGHYSVDAVNSCLSFLIIFMALRIDLMANLFSNRLFVSLGRISIGLYVLHWPIICSFSSWFYVTYNNGSLYMIALNFILTALISLTAGWLFDKYVDINILRFASKVSSYTKRAFGISAYSTEVSSSK